MSLWDMLPQIIKTIERLETENKALKLERDQVRKDVARLLELAKS